MYGKNKQILIFLPEMATYKRKRQYNALFVEKKWLQGRRSSSESVYLKKIRSKLNFKNKISLTNSNQFV